MDVKLRDLYPSTMMNAEGLRQAQGIELIASENFVSSAVRNALGSCLTNKYAEGYPEASSIERFKSTFPDYKHTGNVGRYYGGCQFVDQIELYARYMFQKAFHTDYHVNVQPHSGSSANMAAYMAVLKPGDTILSMNLNNGGHLTHGSPVSFSGKLYNAVFYDVDEKGFIDYDNIAHQIREHRPRLVLAGASAYSRKIDFARIHNIIDQAAIELGYRPYFMVDMAHIAGLVATGLHPTPFGLADIITSTTHKTLRGPRGGLIFCIPELAKKIDSAVFPGTQGGPLMHVIAAKAVCAEEACSDEYYSYMKQVVKNTKAMCDRFIELGYDVITGGTDNHLFLIDFSKTHPSITGLDVQNWLNGEDHDVDLPIALNKNCVPNETRSPKETSGVRIGLAAMTTQGWVEADCIDCADYIDAQIKDLVKSKSTK